MRALESAPKGGLSIGGTSGEFGRLDVLVNNAPQW